MKMSKFLVSGTYTPEGLQGLQEDKASGRRRILKKVIAGLGGKLESIHFSFGGDDVYVLIDMPNNVSVAALSVAASSSGLVSVTTTPLLTVDEMDEALSMATGYVAPGEKS
jgi:uncharacterized protein with GYD domain